MSSLLVDSQCFDKVYNGAINHLLVCKEDGIQQGDYISLSIEDKISDSCVVKVEYVDCEGSCVDEGYCIIGIKRI